MSVAAIGEILYSLPNNLNWKIPKLSDLPQKSDSRIWSPIFGSRTSPMKFDAVDPGWHFYFMPNSGKKPIKSNTVRSSKWIKLSITFESEDVRPVDWVRVGVVDETGRVVNVCDCVWSYTCGVFSEINLVNEEKLKLRQCGAIPNGHLQLYCENPQKVCTPASDAASQAGGSKANLVRLSLTNTISVSTGGNSNTRGWICILCLVKNCANDIKCKSCKAPKAERIKFTSAKNSLATSSSASTAVSSSADDWNCDTCLSKNRITDSKCVDCGVPKSKKMKNAATTAASTGNSSSIGSWLCRQCHKSNFDSETACIACHTPKSNEDKKTGLERLSQNFRDIFKEKRDTDLTIRVQGQEFSVHKLILRARSSVFDDMLPGQQQKKKTRGRKKKTTKKQQESNENVIEIDDCDPAVFEEFLLFVYSGQVENMTCDNVYGLYYAAAKYNLPDLKCECIDFAKRNFSVENICEIIRMAIQHKETELLSAATNYFAMNMDKILATSNWVSFLKDNHVEANKLCIQALTLGFTKKE